MKNSKTYLLALLTMCCIGHASANNAADTSLRTLIVFFDGLRPDYITQEQMPNLYAFSKRGVYGKQHHSVYPTVTRVNSSAYSSGSYPAKNGIMGNTVFFPAVNPVKGLNTGEASELDKITAATNGHLLTITTLGEQLKAAGARMMVFSSGSTGQALLQNHTVSGGAIINPGLILPASLKDGIVSEIGPIPTHAKPNSAQHKWVADALIRYGLAPDGPQVSAIWFSDPDGTAHSDGIGSPTAVASLKSVDQQFGRILAALGSKGLANRTNILISTDHGFVTNVGKDGVSEFLIKQGLKKSAESDDVVVAEGAIYVKNHEEAVIKKIVTALQSQDWVGPVFTKGKKKGDTKGSVEGTLSFELIHWDHAERASDILVDENWDDRKNSTGYAGASFSRGVAGHGGFSPYEVHIALLAVGPSFKKAYASEVPTSNVDLTPTILHLYHIPVPAEMEGRVMTELLEGNKQGEAAKDQVIETTVKQDWGTYKVMVNISTLGKYRYLNFAKTERTYNTTTGK